VLTQIMSVLIVVGVVAIVFFLVRYAIREGEGKDPRWGLVGRPQPGSPIAEMGGRLFAVPTRQGLLLRSSSHREAEWERLYAWPDVDAEQVDGIIRIGGPFGTIVCTSSDDMTADECLGLIRPSASPLP